MRASPLLAALLAFAAAAPGHAQVVRGHVLDYTTGEPVAAVTVEAFAGGNSGGRARSAADGRFEVRLRAPGSFRLEATRTGYRPSVTSTLPVAARETVYVEVRVAAAPMQLDPLRVTARVAPPRRRSLELAGFYDRERFGMGRFIRREDFEKRSNLTTAQVLAREPGTVLQNAGPREYVVFTRSSTINAFQRASAGYCPPLLYLDGTRVGSSTDISNVVIPEMIEGVELYRSTAEIPVQYTGSDASCGVILIWTRHEP